MNLLSGRRWCLLFLLIAPLLLKAELQQAFRLSPDNGLSQGHVNRLLLDSQQQLWLATDGGIDRFDGYRSRPLPAELITSNTVIYDAMLAGPDRLLLATASDGLLEIGLSSQSRRLLHQASPELADYQAEMIYLIRPDPMGTELFADSTRVLTLSDGVQDVQFTLPSKDIHQHFIRDVLAFEHYLLVASSQGLWLHDRHAGQSWQLDYLPSTNSDQQNSKALAADDSTLYIGTVEGLYAIARAELSRLEPAAQRQAVQSRVLLTTENIWRIKIDDDALLLGTNRGLMLLNKDDHQTQLLFRPGRTRYAYYDDSVVDFLRDQHGNFWLATRGDGAYYWQPEQQRFTNVVNTATQQPLSHALVYSIVSDDDAIWVGTQNGLNRLDLTSLSGQAFFVDPDPKVVDSAASFYSLAPAPDGDGLWLLNLEQVQLFSRSKQQVTELPAAITAALSATPYSMAISSSGYLYLHNEAGFFRISPNLSLQPLPIAEQHFQSDWASHWVGEHPTQPGVMLFYDQFTLWAYSDNAPPKALYQLPQGMQQSSAYVEGVQVVGDSLWLLFHGIGLVELALDTLEVRQELFSMAQLPTNILYRLQRDDHGMLWMSSHSGLWRFNPRTGNFRQFTTQQGLANNEFNGLSGTRLPDGRLVFGSVQGLTLFQPSDFIATEAKPPQLLFSELSLVSRSLPPLLQPKSSKNLELRHDDYGLSVHVSTFSYRQQADTRYRFELEGPDRLPVLVSREPYLLLPQLRPGQYRLSVQAFDPLTERYSEPALLRLHVQYSAWQSPLARAGYGFLLLLTVLFWLSWRHQQKRRLLQQNRELQLSKERLQLALSIADSDVWSWHGQHQQLLHPERLQLLGLSAQTVLSFEQYASRIHPDDQTDYLHGWKELCDGYNDHFQQVYRVRDTSNKWHWFKDIGRVTQRLDGKVHEVSGIYTNITAQKLTEQELEQLVHFDSLTQLPNRNYLLQQLDEVLQGPGSPLVSVLFIDLDRFKHINDSLGHEQGNTLLQVVAARLHSQLAQGELLAHLGSDEFVYVLLTTDPRVLAEKSERLHSLLAKPVMLGQQQISISCSIGIASYPEHAADSYELLKHADIAMAYAKRHGELDHAIFTPQMPERTRLKMQLEYQLKQAILQQQLQNYYQPIVDSLQKRTLGVELLLRWQQDGQMIPPDQFIPMAEELDLMAELTWNSLQKALHDLQQWHQQGFPLYLSVNLAASQLSSNLFADRLAELIAAKVVDPSYLRLEITESSLMKNRQQAIKNMHRLKAMGIQLYLDDFGTGYSSLTYLKDFPIDLIKIDRSFVFDLTHDSRNAILNTIIALAQNMALPCIAEGVETQYQLNYLQQQGCHLIQGYWYS
ncbi:MAG: EAL domain-containing protein, partial [Alkalimonas sp.]|nr:EAL domain-containing protein [Alkalimonas sp.]